LFRQAFRTKNQNTDFENGPKTTAPDNPEGSFRFCRFPQAAPTSPAAEPVSNTTRSRSRFAAFSNLDLPLAIWLLTG
jgi:hypothetical protein